MSALTEAVSQAFRPAMPELAQLIEYQIEAMGFYRFEVELKQYAPVIGDKIMKARLSDSYWIRRVDLPAQFANDQSLIGQTEYILYQKNRKDIVFDSHGFQILPENLLYNHIAYLLDAIGLPIHKKWENLVKIDCRAKGQPINFRIEVAGQALETHYEFLASEILLPPFTHVYEAKIDRLKDLVEKKLHRPL